MSEGIGERLREARTSRGIELDEAERQIKIRKRFLVAMEEERWEVLPGAAYVRGFLHTYAALLGLDADAVVDEYRRVRRAQQGPEPELEPEPQPPPQLPASEQRLGAGRAPISDRVPRGPWVLVAAGVAAVLAILLVLGITGGSDDEGDEQPERAAPEQPAPAAAPEEAEEQREPSLARVELTATGDVWVCLVSGAGEQLVEGVTVPVGEKEGPFRARSFDLTLGNGQVELEANGEPVEIAAPAEPVGLRITPDRTRELEEGERPTCA
jgi:hypothetical protein